MCEIRKIDLFIRPPALYHIGRVSGLRQVRDPGYTGILWMIFIQRVQNMFKLYAFFNFQYKFHVKNKVSFILELKIIIKNIPTVCVCISCCFVWVSCPVEVMRWGCSVLQKVPNKNRIHSSELTSNELLSCWRAAALDIESVLLSDVGICSTLKLSIF